MLATAKNSTARSFLHCGRCEEAGKKRKEGGENEDPVDAEDGDAKIDLDDFDMRSEVLQKELEEAVAGKNSYEQFRIKKMAKKIGKALNLLDEEEKKKGVSSADEDEYDSIMSGHLREDS